MKYTRKIKRGSTNGDWLENQAKHDVIRLHTSELHVAFPIRDSFHRFRNTTPRPPVNNLVRSNSRVYIHNIYRLNLRTWALGPSPAPGSPSRPRGHGCNAPREKGQPHSLGVMVMRFEPGSLQNVPHHPSSQY